MSLTGKQVQKKYNRYSTVYDLLEWLPEKMLLGKLRKPFLENIKGNVLEIGVGTGKNLPYYNYNKVDLTAIDISQGMLHKAKKVAKENKFPVNLQLVEEEKLPFKDNTFDYVVMTFVLCSVPNQHKMLYEMKRVVKKEGKIVLLEHMLSKNKIIAFFEHLHNPITKALVGVNINRKTIDSIRECGLKINKEKNIALKDVFKELEVQK
ncbi:methyltransferase type 11 [Candidatus Woesearchaeota archaeon CG10_big_fil_rev_8_21_14_0_10_32_24]|nr:MAG: methyltransferase type 11 [Candidatus Woesearchaeota archaeon CG10_big_fil_rev_8_21_14_0_10_32_24]